VTAPRSPWTPDEPDTPNVVPDPPLVKRDEPERAEVDLLIARPDLGPAAHTLVAAGEAIPRGLTGLARRPATGENKPRAKATTTRRRRAAGPELHT
jgi:hypothetical protein